MVNSEKPKSADAGRGDDLDQPDQISDSQESLDVSSRDAEDLTRPNQSVTRRLRGIFTGDDDADLLMQTSDREEGFLHWLRALDMQVMGACRADERLKPFLKLNVSAAAEDDGLLAHLSQHFEPPEVCMLARCLCIPLVSVRVGKISQQGTVLSPTTVRGNLCLTLLPNSDMRVSFNGDDGSVEKLSTLNTVSRCTDIEIKEISADTSGRSFFIRSPEFTSYYWCSEKSKLLGNELLQKMKDLLCRKPSLAELTGINESRIDCFGTRIREYLAGSVTSGAHPGGITSEDLSSDFSGAVDRHVPQPSSQSQKSLRVRQVGNQGSRGNLISSLSPRPSSFKENLQKSLSAVRSLGREKSRQRYYSLPSFSDLAATCDSSRAASSRKEKLLPEVSGPNSFMGFSGLDFLSKSTELPSPSSEDGASLLVSLPVSPHYCWCPPVASALQFTVGHQLSSSSEPLSLPPLSSSLFTSKPLLSFADAPPPLDFPSIMPDPFLKFPGSQQIPTFTPLMSDPIVHIPMIDVCSSGGQGYLVSAGPSSMPPLSDPLLPKAESVIEKGARETLRMLISGSSQPKQQLLEILPCVLSSAGCDIPSAIVAGSRGLYCGTRDADDLSNSMSCMGLRWLSEKSEGRRCSDEDVLAEPKNKSHSHSSGCDPCDSAEPSD